MPFRSVARTENHDRFGLAVLIFHLMFMGRHPFFGRFLGAGDMPLERAIRELRFAFGPAASFKQMAPPPHSLPFSALPPDVAGLFERAFSDRSTTTGRPTAREWHQALSSLLKQLVVCQSDTSHKFPSGLASCPWCGIVAAGGPAFFIMFQSGVVEFVCTATDLDSLVAELQRLAVPAAPASVAVVSAQPPVAALLPQTAHAAQKKMMAAKVVTGGGGALAAVGLILLLALSAMVAGGVVVAFGITSVVFGWTWLWWLSSHSEYGKERRRRQLAFEQAQRLANQAEATAQGIAAGVHTLLQQAQGRGDGLRREYVGLRAAYEAELRSQAQDKQAAQRRGYFRAD